MNNSHSHTLLFISNIILALALAYQSNLIRSKFSITQYKCPESTNPIKSTHINLETKEVLCTYHLPVAPSKPRK